MHTFNILYTYPIDTLIHISHKYVGGVDKRKGTKAKKRHKILFKKKKYCQKALNQSIHKTVLSRFLNRELTKPDNSENVIQKVYIQHTRFKVNLLTEKILFHQVFCTEYCKGNKKIHGKN